MGGIIVSPTRELASQISEVIEEFLKESKSITQLLLIGGKPLETDLSLFEEKGANIIVATPGRLEDILSGKSKSVPTSLRNGIKALVSFSGALYHFLGFIVFTTQRCLSRRFWFWTRLIAC